MWRGASAALKEGLWREVISLSVKFHISKHSRFFLQALCRLLWTLHSLLYIISKILWFDFTVRKTCLANELLCLRPGCCCQRRILSWKFVKERNCHALLSCKRVPVFHAVSLWESLVFFEHHTQISLHSQYWCHLSKTLSPKLCKYYFKAWFLAYIFQWINSLVPADVLRPRSSWTYGLMIWGWLYFKICAGGLFPGKQTYLNDFVLEYFILRACMKQAVNKRGLKAELTISCCSPWVWWSTDWCSTNKSS